MAWEYVGDILRLIVLGGLGVAGILTVLLWKKNLATKVTYLRFVVQAVAFTALFYLFSLYLPLLYYFIIIFAIPSFSEALLLRVALPLRLYNGPRSNAAKSLAHTLPTHA